MTDSVYQLLYAPRRIDQQIGRISAKIRSLRDSLELSGVRYDTDRVQSSPSDRMSAIIAEIDALEHKRDELIDGRIRAIEQIEEAVNGLSDETERTVLYMQYIGRERMDDIAETIGYSRSRLYEIRSRALRSLDAVHPSQERRKTVTTIGLIDCITSEELKERGLDPWPGKRQDKLDK